jgi:hypothetical protein
MCILFTVAPDCIHVVIFLSTWSSSYPRGLLPTGVARSNACHTWRTWFGGSSYSPYAAKLPVLIWGSSIGQGGVVQNAGMPWISQVGRSLEREVYNFGFSGSCLMQPEVAK